MCLGVRGPGIAELRNTRVVECAKPCNLSIYLSIYLEEEKRERILFLLLLLLLLFLLLLLLLLLRRSREREEEEVQSAAPTGSSP